SNFPTVNGFQSGNAGGKDAFVTKVAADGKSLVFSTYLGGGTPQGNADDVGYAVAVSPSGDVFVGGSTASSDFPVTSGALQTSGGTLQGFVTRLSATGSALIYSTYLGNGPSAQIYGLAVSPSGKAYVTGYTVDNMGLGNSFLTTPGAFQTSH